MIETGICYLRAGDSKGSLLVTPGFERLNYVLLHTNGENAQLFKLKTKGHFQIWTRKTLQQHGFEPRSAAYYVVLHFDPSKPIPLKRLSHGTAPFPETTINMKRILLPLFMMLLPLMASAYDAEVDGIYYNLNTEAKTAEVTYKEYLYNSYSDTVKIPASITYSDVTYSVTSIGDNAFCYCSNLTDVYCFADSVPKTDSNIFSDTPIDNATLHVFEADIDAYRTTVPWSGFGNIVAIDNEVMTEIKSADATNNGKKTDQIFTLDEKPQNELRKGINIVKYSDGTTRKVVKRSEVRGKR